MKTKLFFLIMMVAIAVSCKTAKEQVVDRSDPLFESLKTGMTKQEIVGILGNDFKFDMNNVTQTQANYVETLIWNSPNPNVAYVITFVNNKLSRKTQEQVVKENGKNVQINR